MKIKLKLSAYPTGAGIMFLIDAGTENNVSPIPNVQGKATIDTINNSTLYRFHVPAKSLSEALDLLSIHSAGLELTTKIDPALLKA